MSINWGINRGTTQQQGSQALGFFQQALVPRGQVAAAAPAPGPATVVAAPVVQPPAAAPVGDVPVGNAAQPTGFMREPVTHVPEQGGGMRGAIARAFAGPGPAASAPAAAEPAAAAAKAPGLLAQLRQTPRDQIFSALNGGRQPGARVGVQGGELLARLRSGAAPVAEQVGQAAGEVAATAARTAGEINPVAAKLFQLGTQGASRMGTSGAEIGKLGEALLKLHIKP